MKVLKTGIYTKVTALVGGNHNTFYNSISGRFYFEVAPQDATFPFCTYHIITDTYEYQFVDEFQNVIVQFNIYSENSSSSEADDVFEYLKTLMDWATITVTGYTNYRTERIYDTSDYFADDGVWQITVQYRIRLIKS